MENKLHICFISSEYPPGQIGGLGAFLQTIGRALVKQGHFVSVVGLNTVFKDVEEDDEGVKVYRLSPSTWPIARFYGNFQAINKKLKEIHSQNPISLIEAAELGLAFIDKNLPFKKIIRMHGGHHFFALTLGKSTAFWRSFQEKKSFSKSDAFIAVSDFVGKKTFEYLKVKNSSYKVIFNPINLIKFYSTDRSKIEKNTLLFIGTICEKKGIKELIEAIPKVKDLYPNIILKVIGRDWIDKETKESYLDKMKSLVSTLQLEKNIQFIGAVETEEIPNYLEKAEICVYPSHMESFGIVVTEAKCMGKVVLFGDKGPARELINHLDDGLLVDPHNPIDIADKIILALQNEELKKQIHQKAIESRDLYDVEKLVRKNIEFYQSVVS